MHLSGHFQVRSKVERGEDLGKAEQEDTRDGRIGTTSLTFYTNQLVC